MTDPTAPEDTVTAAVVENAAPVDVDPQDMLRQLVALQAQVEQMRTEQRAALGQPSDPVAAAVRDLKDHVKARTVIAIPGRREELKDLIDEVDTMTESPSENDLSILADLFDETADFEGKTYCRQQVTALRRLVRA